MLENAQNPQRPLHTLLGSAAACQFHQDGIDAFKIDIQRQDRELEIATRDSILVFILRDFHFVDSCFKSGQASASFLFLIDHVGSNNEISTSGSAISIVPFSPSSPSESDPQTGQRNHPASAPIYLVSLSLEREYSKDS